MSSQDPSLDGVDMSVLRERIPGAFRNGQVGRCVSSVTHDVNNYLGVILAYSELIQQSGELSEEARRMMSNIVANVHRCSGVLGTLTAIARKPKPDINVVAMPEFLTQVLDLKRHECRVERVALELNCAANLPSLVIDRPKIMMALLYLLANGLEALQTAETKRIDVSVLLADKNVEIEVRDSGPGVDEKDRDRIFNAFYTTKAEDHLGLGLTLAREAAVYHDGSLGYESGRGFVLRLPVASRLKL